MATDGMHHSAYDPAVVGPILGEAAHLLRHLGFAAEHTVLIGGIVPSLLVLDPPRPHLGTGDLDVCLSLAIVQGDTAEYERIETALGNAGYEPTDRTFKWKQKGRLRLEVEFFCPAGDDRPSGAMFRPKAADNPVGKHNFGGKLTAIALDAGGVIGSDVVVVDREVVLPEGAGRTTWSFRVTGVLGFLVAKVGALVGRVKTKDAYDIVWIIENWPEQQAGVAQAIRESPAYGSEEAVAGLERLFEKFLSVDELGPTSYASFMSDEQTSNDDRQRLARQAVGAVQELQRALDVR